LVSVPKIVEDIPNFGLITATKNLLEDLFRRRRFEILKNLQEFSGPISQDPARIRET
jgi:hypothetical protein